MGKPIEKEEVRRRKNNSSNNNIVGSSSGIGGMTYADDDIPDDEKLRLIKETGIMNNFKNVEIVDVNKALKENKFNTGKGNDGDNDDDDDDPFKYGYTFQAILYTIPLCATYSMMDILVHKQYNQDVLFDELIIKLVKIIPKKNWIQIPMFFGSILCGSYLIYIVNKSSYYGVMRRCPPLATLWIYFVMQLRLTPSVFSLIMVYLYFRYGDPNFKI
nr:10030_t:CDS:2 [Entrophospora candida]